MGQYRNLITSTDIIKGQSEDKLMRYTRSEVNFSSNTPLHRKNPFSPVLLFGPLCYRLTHANPEHSNHFEYGNSEDRYLGSKKYRWGPIKFIQVPENGYTEPSVNDMLADPLNLSFGSHTQKCRIESKSMIDFLDDGQNIDLQIDPAANGVDQLVQALLEPSENNDGVSSQAAAMEQAFRSNVFKEITAQRYGSSINSDVTALLGPRDWLDFLFGNKNPNSENYERFSSGIFEGKLLLPDSFVTPNLKDT